MYRIYNKIKEEEERKIAAATGAENRTISVPIENALSSPDSAVLVSQEKHFLKFLKGRRDKLFG